MRDEACASLSPHFLGMIWVDTPSAGSPLDGAPGPKHSPARGEPPPKGIALTAPNVTPATRGAAKRGPMSDNELALVSGGVFDIPPKTRRILVGALLLGIVLIVVESLVGNKTSTIGTDKIIHFCGYAILAGTAVLALKPAKYVMALVVLFLMGAGVELLQSFTGRSMDWHDQMANTVGLLAGGTAGIGIRYIYSQVSAEQSRQRARERLHTYAANDVILSEGDTVDYFCVVKSGEVEVSVRVGEEFRVLGRVGPGSVLGLPALIEGKGQLTTLRATERTRVYNMTLEELMDSAGDRQAPIAMVLHQLTGYTRLMGKALAEHGIQVDGTQPGDAVTKTHLEPGLQETGRA